MHLTSNFQLSLIACVFTVGKWMIRPVTCSSEIRFDDAPGLGRVFDGIGGLSAGASSKLLMGYPAEQRDQILDYLFKPRFGASLQILKVEIGGDAQSTDGTEASHMHNSWEENYDRGYEWWLMKEAKKRNPDIKLYGLPWGFPGWIGQGHGSPYTNLNVTADYIIKWIAGAKSHHNLSIDYIGLWNERPFNTSYIKTLRNQLDVQGFEMVNMVIADTFNWDIAKAVENNAALASCAYALGDHYPGTDSTIWAKWTGKQLWSSEDFSTFNDEVGGGCWARILNQNYVHGLMTATISWSLIGSYYSGLPYYSDGLMTAAQPWSGNYEVKTPIWLSAHTTQFTSPGWKYLAHDDGVGELPKGGSYVSLVSPEGDQLTIIIETMTHDHSLCIRPHLPKYKVKPQKITITLQGSFAPIAEMNVWYSKLDFDGANTTMFEKKEPLQFKNGQASLSLGLDEVYTLTTITDGQKGSYPSPPSPTPFPLPYKDDFEKYTLNQEPYNLAQQIGAFEVLSTEGNQFIRQMVLSMPVMWCSAETVMKSYNVIGNSTWSDIFVEIEFSIPSVNGTDGVFVAARADKAGCDSNSSQGIYFFVLHEKYMLTTDLARSHALMEGTISYLPGWHKLSFLVQRQIAMGAFDEKGLFNVTIPAKPAQGWVALGTDSFGLADFDNLSIATKEEGLTKMEQYFQVTLSQPLYFMPEEH